MATLSDQPRQKPTTPLVEGLYTLLEIQILMFAVRFPEQLKSLFDIGADLALRTQASRKFWNKIRRKKPYRLFLNPTEQKLVDQWLGFKPPTKSDFECEYADLKRSISLFQAVEDQEIIAESWRIKRNVE